MTENDSPLILGTGRIGSLLKSYALPAIIAMTASSLYHIVDSIFIGQGVGPLAIAGLALTFPLMNLAAAFGSLVGVGASTLIAVKLGQRDYEGANKALGNVCTLNILLGISFSAVCLYFLTPILYFFGAGEQTLGYAREFMEIILMGNLVTHLYLGLNAVLRSSGHPRMAMYATLASVGINCILNPLFIFGFGWGIRGSAWATVISQVISLAWQLRHFADPKNLLHFRRGIYRLRKEFVRNMFAIGLSPFLMNLCASLIVLLINRGLKQYGGDMAIGAYGIVNRILFLFIMIVMGLNQGMQPIAGYNFGARRLDRVLGVTRLTIAWAVGVSLTGFLICQLFPAPIVRLFTSDAELIRISVEGLHIVFAVFPLVGFQMVATNFFLSVGMAREAIFLSLTRQLLFMLPCLVVLPRFFGIWGVWSSPPLSDLLASILTAAMLFRQFRRFKKIPTLSPDKSTR
ncbi:MAG: MATE family efflux transporter [Tannerellaceae bacterium]|jgi:putative MATE family efflux protein|nr:MATE family efflux transporter [Tannerellaceae bacterium]